MNFVDTENWDGRSFTLGSEHTHRNIFPKPLTVDGQGGYIRLENIVAGTATYELSIYYFVK